MATASRDTRRRLHSVFEIFKTRRNLILSIKERQMRISAVLKERWVKASKIVSLISFFWPFQQRNCATCGASRPTDEASASSGNIVCRTAGLKTTIARLYEGDHRCVI